MHDIFISYSRSDIAIALQIKADIETKTSAKCWMDIDGIESGTQFKEKIISAIEQAQIVIFLMSSVSMKSKWTKDEVDFARNIEKTVIPVNIDNSKPTNWFLFTFGRTDIIFFNEQFQKVKFFNDLIKWFPKNDKTSNLNVDTSSLEAEKGQKETNTDNPHADNQDNGNVDTRQKANEDSSLSVDTNSLKAEKGQKETNTGNVKTNNNTEKEYSESSNYTPFIMFLKTHNKLLLTISILPLLCYFIFLLHTGNADLINSLTSDYSKPYTEDIRQLQQPIRNYVCDFACILSKSFKSNTERVLESCENNTSIKIMVVTETNIYGEELNSFAKYFGEKYINSDDGIVIFVRPETDNNPTANNIIISTIGSIENDLNGEFCKQIVENEMLPVISANKDYGRAIENALDVIIPVLTGTSTYKDYCQTHKNRGKPQ